jgi:hypothetical protein
MPSRKASWSPLSYKEHHDNHKTIEDATHRLVWSYRLHKSIGGNKYGLVIVDDYSRFTWVFFLQEWNSRGAKEVLEKGTKLCLMPGSRRLEVTMMPNSRKLK